MPLIIKPKIKFYTHVISGDKPKLKLTFFKKIKIKKYFKPIMEYIQIQSIEEFKPFLQNVADLLNVEKIKLTIKFEFIMTCDHNIECILISYKISFGKGISGYIWQDGSLFKIKIDNINFDSVQQPEDCFNASKFFKNKEDLHIDCEVPSRISSGRCSKNKYKNYFLNIIFKSFLFLFGFYFHHKISYTTKEISDHFKKVNSLTDKIFLEFRYNDHNCGYIVITCYSLYKDTIKWSIEYDKLDFLDFDDSNDSNGTLSGAHEISSEYSINDISKLTILKSFSEIGLLNREILNYDIDENITNEQLSELLKISKIMDY